METPKEDRLAHSLSHTFRVAIWDGDVVLDISNTAGPHTSDEIFVLRKDEAVLLATHLLNTVEDIDADDA